MPDPEPSSATGTTLGARDHARAMAGTRVETMPTMPPSDAPDLPSEVTADDVLWDETVAGGGYTSVQLPVGARLRLVDVGGDACAGLLLHRASHPSERLNVADTVKVQWQAYLGEGMVLLSDMGRTLASILEDTSGRHDTFCGTTTRVANDARYGDGAIDGASPNGRDLFALALAKRGRSRREVAPNVNLFKGTHVAEDGTLGLHPSAPPGAHVTLRADLDVLATVVNVPHPLDDRPDYTVTPLRVTAWRGPAAGAADPVRSSAPETERAFLNSEVDR